MQNSLPPGGQVLSTDRMGDSPIAPPPSWTGSATLFQLAPLLECDDIPVTVMSALGAGARPAPCQHAMEHDYKRLE